MTTPYAHLIKLYQMLIVESYNKEMEKQRFRPPSRVVVGWLGAEGLCVVCGVESGQVGLHEELQQVEETTEGTNSILDLIFTTFHVEIVDEYKCAELCEGCLNRLKDADLFRSQVEAANEPLQEAAKTEGVTSSDVPKTKVKRNIFTMGGKKEAAMPPKLDKNAKACPVCGEQAIDYYHLRVHYMRHYLNLICEICGRGFYKQKSLDTHMMQHAEKKITCQFCNKDYATKLALAQHVKSVHNKVKMYPCKQCTLRFSSSTTRMKHMWEEHGIPCRMYECERCSQPFYTIQQRDLHNKRIHLQIKDHECEWCDFSAVSSVELANHRTKHSDVRKYSCEQCGKLFKSQRSVREHVKTHQVAAIAQPEENNMLQHQLMQVDHSDTIQIDDMSTITFITL